MDNFIHMPGPRSFLVAPNFDVWRVLVGGCLCQISNNWVECYWPLALGWWSSTWHVVECYWPLAADDHWLGVLLQCNYLWVATMLDVQLKCFDDADVDVCGGWAAEDGEQFAVEGRWCMYTSLHWSCIAVPTAAVTQGHCLSPCSKTLLVTNCAQN